MMPRAIVAGGSGFIGYHLAKDLADQGLEVTIIDNFSRSKTDRLFEQLINRSNVIFINADMTEKDFYAQLSGKYDYVYHLAAINGTQNFYDKPYLVLRANLLTLLNMLEWCCSDNCGSFLFASSSETYAGTISAFGAEHPEFLPTDENIPLTIDNVLNPRFSYGGSKIVGEIMTSNYCHMAGIPFRIVRYHNIYGPRMGYDHVLPQFIKRITERQNPYKIYGGEETRAFCHIRDCVKATKLVMETDACAGEIIHIGNSTEEIKIKDLLDMLLAIADYEPSIEIASAPLGCVVRRCPNTDKLRRLTGFQAQIGLAEGLPEIYRWYVEDYSKG